MSDYISPRACNTRCDFIYLPWAFCEILHPSSLNPHGHLLYCPSAHEDFHTRSYTTREWMKTPAVFHSGSSLSTHSCPCPHRRHPSFFLQTRCEQLQSSLWKQSIGYCLYDCDLLMMICLSYSSSALIHWTYSKHRKVLDVSPLNIN